MSARDDYPSGVPCWVDTLQPDPAAAREFYGKLFGWDFTAAGTMPGDPPGEYFVARLRGSDVAGVGTQPDGVPPAWNTYVSVASADAATDATASAGGQVIAGPIDAAPAGRLGVIADPSGASLCVWEAGERNGAQLVNEPGAWTMSALRTSQQDRCADFYRAVFGWESESFAPGVALFRLPGVVGGEPQQPVPRDVVAAMVEGDAGTPSEWSVNFWVQDADLSAEDAGRLGGAVLAGPSDAGGMRQVVLADPAGVPFSATTAPGPR